MRTIGRGSAAAAGVAAIMELEDGVSCTESLKVSALKYLSETGKLEQLRDQCVTYRSEVGTVGELY